MTAQRIDGLKLLNFASHIDANTIEQGKQTAAMPFVHPHVALMPDAHAGKGSAVGTVNPHPRRRHPGRGRRGHRLRHDRRPHRVHGGRGGDSRPRAIPVSAGNYNQGLDRFPFTAARVAVLEELAATNGNADRGVELSHSPKWRGQLGSLGGGNHFIELCLDEEDRVWMFLHSGSRGVGNKIAQQHIKVAQQLCARWWIDLPNPDLAYLPQGTPEFTAYIRELKWAQRFALKNRAEMADRFAQVFADWIGVSHDDVSAFIESTVSCHHNYTQREKHGGRDVWLTRKGAVDAHEGVRAVIPGSMGTRSYVVRGKGNQASLCSAPHGAGRRFSRTEAMKRFTADDLAARMKGIEYRHGDEWVDEIPDAYKDIDVVMADAADLVEVEHTLAPGAQRQGHLTRTRSRRVRHWLGRQPTTGYPVPGGARGAGATVSAAMATPAIPPSTGGCAVGLTLSAAGVTPARPRGINGTPTTAG